MCYLTKTLRSLIWLIFTLACTYFSTLTFVHAATVSVTPLIIDLELEKRDIVYKEITITNLGSQQVRVFPSVNEVSLAEDGGIKEFVQPSMIDDRSTAITSWIEVPRKRMDIPPGESATLPVTFRVNPNVKAGEYHAVIGLGTGSNQPEAHQKVLAGIAPVVAVAVSVDKVQNEFLRLERFSVERVVTSNQDGSIRYSLHNPGDDPVTPAGEIIFYDNRGIEVYSQPVNPEQLTVEPGTSVEVTDNAPTDLKMGKYKAFLSVEFGQDLTASIHDTAFFYVLPIKHLIILFAIVLITAVVIALYVHRRYDVGDVYDDEMLADVPLYIRTERSESKDHDIDLSKKA